MMDSTQENAVKRLQKELQVIIDCIAQTMSADVVTMLLYDESTNEFVLTMGQGLLDGDTFRDRRMRPRADRVAGRIAGEQAEIIMDGAAGNPSVSGAFSQREKVVSAGGFPIVDCGHTCGVLFVSYRHAHVFSERDREDIRKWARQASTIIASTAGLPLLRPDVPAPSEEDRMYRSAVRLACDVVNIPACIWVLESDMETFRIRAYSGLTTHYLDNATSAISDGGLISKVFRTRTWKLVSDLQNCASFAQKEAARQAGWVSWLGVPIKLRGKIRGVIEVFYSELKDSEPRELEALTSLADMAGVAAENMIRSEESRLLLNKWEQVEDVTSRLYRRDEILKEVCQLITETGYDFVALQSIRKDHGIIETVAGTGIAKNWAGRLGHYLAEDRKLQDIQASVAKAWPPRIEIIAGWDDRFDPWIFKTFHHEHLSRIWAPILVVRDPSGVVDPAWFERCELKYIETPMSKDGDGKSEGRRATFEITPPGVSRENAGRRVEVIGTVEAGYKNPDREISRDEAETLLKLVGRQTQSINITRLSYVLEAMLEPAMDIVKADSASFHFLYTHPKSRYDPRTNPYVYECACRTWWPFLKDNRPGVRGMGQKAIRREKHIFMTGGALRNYNGGALDRAGIRAVVAFPVLVDKRSGKVGVVYLHFRKAREIGPAEVKWVELFVSQAEKAIRHAINYGEIRDRARQLDSLRAAFESLVTRPDLKALLEDAASHTLNFFGADVVTIYAYEASSRTFSRPARAGRLSNPQDMETAVGPNDVPALIIKRGKSLYKEHTKGNKILYDRERHKLSSRNDLPFVDREGIVATAAVPLKAEEETVGVMFLNYRRAHEFPEEERSITETLASSIAVAIQRVRRHNEHVRQLETAAEFDKFGLNFIHCVGNLWGAIPLSCDNLKIAIQRGDKAAVAEAMRTYEEGVERVERILNEADRMKTLQSAVRRSVNINNMIMKVLRSTTVPNNVRVRRMLGRDLPKILVKELHFRDALHNLISNAYRALQKTNGGELSIATVLSGDGSLVTLTVEDNGCGISRDVLDNLFRPFLMTKGGGLGLGLWLARQTIKEMGGSIDVDRSRAKGAKFTITLPVSGETKK